MGRVGTNRQEQHPCPACNRPVTVDIEVVPHPTDCAGCGFNMFGHEHWDGTYETTRTMRRVLERSTLRPHDCAGYTMRYCAYSVD